MKYFDGQEARLGDRVKLGDDDSGIVVCSIDTDEFSVDYPIELREAFKSGIVVVFRKWGTIHYTTPESDLVLLMRKSNVGCTEIPKM
jgi:hypothetical protein